MRNIARRKFAPSNRRNPLVRVDDVGESDAFDLAEAGLREQVVVLRVQRAIEFGRAVQERRVFELGRAVLLRRHHLDAAAAESVGDDPRYVHVHIECERH